MYGPAIKQLIHEDFGDGIMSAINFRLGVERSEVAARRGSASRSTESSCRISGERRALLLVGGDRRAVVPQAWRNLADGLSI